MSTGRQYQSGRMGVGRTARPRHAPHFLAAVYISDLLLTLIEEAAEAGQQDLPWLEDEGHVQRRKSTVCAADR